MHNQSQAIGMAVALGFAVSVDASTLFDLSFFDQTNSIVGNGRLTIDPTARVCVSLAPVGDCGSALPTNTTTRTQVLTNFSATIQGEPWGLETASAWWGAEVHLPGHQVQTRTGLGLAEGTWFLGDPFFSSRSLSMSFNEATAISGNGLWAQSVMHRRDGTIAEPPLSGAGNWVATAVPLPAAWALLVSALIPGGWLVLRRRGNMTK
jgi:hypothetical protein